VSPALVGPPRRRTPKRGSLRRGVPELPCANSSRRIVIPRKMHATSVRTIMAACLVAGVLVTWFFWSESADSTGSDLHSPILPTGASDGVDSHSGEVDSGAAVERMPVGQILSDDEQAQFERSESTGQVPADPDGPGPKLVSLFESRYQGLSPRELFAAMEAVKETHDELRETYFQQRRELRLVHESFQTEPGFVSVPKDAPQAKYVRVIAGPEEHRDPLGVARVWHIYLTEQEYPDLYELRSELAWLSAALEGS